MVRFFENLAQWTIAWTGSSPAFIVALFSIIVWIACGPICGYSMEWQLVVNSATTIITFLMVFLIQRAHNKETLAIQLKLDALLAAQKSNKPMIGIEALSERDILELKKRFEETEE